MILRTMLLIPGVLCVLGCTRAGDAPRPSGAAASRAFGMNGFSWRVIEVPEARLNLYIQRTDGDDDVQQIVDSAKRAQADVLSLLAESKSGGQTSSLFFVRSRSDMQRISGRPIAGFVQPGEPTAFFVWSRGYRAPVRHELAHLYTFDRWGRPPGGDSATWLVEGIGALAGGSCQGKSADALAAGLLARDRLPSVADLVQRFREIPEDAGLPAAGSLTEFLYAKEGIHGLRARWQSPSGAMLPDSASESAWRAHVKSVLPAELDIARVMREGC